MLADGHLWKKESACSDFRGKPSQKSKVHVSVTFPLDEPSGRFPISLKHQLFL
jgi:hypothetical protein